jgi:hypothetical protein|tara:strand:+ start:19455 stop:19766 length:312 start_codon:yes stop_codon:yes gene_type:complete
MSNEILLGLNIVSFVIIIINMVLIARIRKFENEHLKVVFNLLLVGLFFITLTVIFDNLVVISKFTDILSIIPFDIFNVALGLAIIPISALLFIVSLLYIKEIE